MHRHVSAPSRFFSQLPNDIIRHPRLSATAVRLLAWQLSLPEGADEPLWKTAERAGIGKVAFQHAKRQLRAERYLFEWRHQNEHGRWQTVQLVANTPLSPDEARVAVQPAARPTAALPATGAPTRRPAAPQPRKTPVGNTSHPPATTEATEAPEAAAPRLGTEIRARAEALLLSLPRTAPYLAMPARKARRWAPLAARWLECGLGTDDVRTALTAGLEQARSPLGALRWRLEHALPEPVATSPTTQAAPPRVSRMRECAGPHTQPLLFTPVGNEDRCPTCRTTAAATATPAPPPGTGLRTFHAARAARAARTARPARAARAARATLTADGLPAAAE
ncbi:hypothetical protein MMF93_20170 [Streptomyces tubbatahanensis]|uniref:Uncharacterized protein n=1 Tax=Streptomyces tubbatahanensis TaxID=2923272 RepID=A0ABY3XW78_9ACTN|nr:hypothetical protein [Streptomyces tubbatahanensis]UNS98513.1 hypothetical protein MMF93_20170 [Streptomyces tubbatahanensis]